MSNLPTSLITSIARVIFARRLEAFAPVPELDTAETWHLTDTQRDTSSIPGLCDVSDKTVPVVAGTRQRDTVHQLPVTTFSQPYFGVLFKVNALQWCHYSGYREREMEMERERESCCWCNNIAVRVSGIFYLQSHPPQQIYLSLTSIKESIRDVNNYKPSNLMWIINHRVEREKEGRGEGGGSSEAESTQKPHN